MELQVRVTGRTRLLRVLVSVLFVLAIVDDYQGWRFLLLGLAGAWGLSFYWARSLSRSLRLRREMRFDWAQVGDVLEERLTLSNTGIFPALWVELIDHSNMPGYQASMATGLEANSSYQWHTNGPCTRRGLFTLGPSGLRASDPLGLYSVELHDPRYVTLMVTPPIVPLPEILVAPGGRAGQGRPRPNAPERTVSASTVRQYAPGDSLRYIHWRTTARRDNLFIRLFESTPSGDWWIILDADQGVQAGEGARSTEEHGVILAASLTDRGLRMGKAVGLAAHGKTLAWLPPKDGEGQRWEILRTLALLETAPHPLDEFLNAIRPSIGQNASLVIITPNVDGNWLKELLPFLWHGSVPSVLLLDPESFRGMGNALKTGAAQAMLFNLARSGFYSRLITPDLLDRPEAQPGRRGRWEWRISPTGRAIPVMPTRDTSWRGLP